MFTTTKKKIFWITTFVIAILLVLFYVGVLRINLPDIRTTHLWLPFVVAASALIDSTNPCAFSILFLTVTFLFGMKRDRKFVTWVGLIYVFGIFFTYVAIGLGILKALSFFNIPNGIARIGALILIVYAAINIINEYFPKFPIKLTIPDFSKGEIAVLINKASLPAAFFLGIFVGIFEFPCTGGPYLFVLSLLHSETTRWVGLMYLIIYNILFVLPLLVVLFWITSKNVAESLDEIRRKKTKQYKIIMSVILIALAGLVFLI